MTYGILEDWTGKWGDPMPGAACGDVFLGWTDVTFDWPPALPRQIP